MTQGVSFKIPLFERAPDDWQQVTYHRYWIHEDITHSVYANDGIRTWRHKSIYWYDTNLGLEDFRSIDSDQREWWLFDCQEDPLELIKSKLSEDIRLRSGM